MVNDHTDTKRALDERERIYHSLEERGIACERRADPVKVGIDIIPAAP
jgi:hypothetical protein